MAVVDVHLAVQDSEFILINIIACGFTQTPMQ